MSARKLLLGSIVVVALVVAALLLFSVGWRGLSFAPTTPAVVPGVVRADDLVAAPDLEKRAFVDPAEIHDDLLEGSAPGESRIVRGFVRTLLGEPVPGATVSIEGRPGESVTGEDGSFRLDDVPPGTWVVRAHGVAGTCTPVEFVAPEPFPIVLTFEPFGRLHVEVTDPTGAPLPNARISLIFGSHRTSRGAEVLARGMTDASGQLTYESFPARSLHLYVRHVDYAPTRSEMLIVRSGEECKARVRMQEGARIVGTVTNGGEAVSGATIQFREHDVTITNEDGRYELNGLETGEHRLQVNYGGSRVEGPYEIRQVRLRDGETLRCDFHGLGTHPVRGSVVRNGAPCPALVTIRQNGVIQRPEVDPAGQFVVLLGTGEATFEIGSRDRDEARPVEHSFVHQIRGPDELVFPVPTGTIRGRLFDPGKRLLSEGRVILRPVDASRHAEPLRTKTRHGGYRIDDLLPGEYRIEAYATGPPLGYQQPIPRPTGRATAVATLLDSEVLEIDLVVEDGPRIEGRVLSTRGAPRGAGTVFVFDLEGELKRRGSVRNTASFEIDGLTAGSYSLVVTSGTEITPVESVMLDAESGAQVEVRIGLGAMLRVEIGSGPFDMKLVDSHGIDFTTLGHEHTSIPRGSYDTGYVLGPLPPGDYTLTAIRNGIELIEPVRIGTEDVKLTLSFGE